MIVNLTPHDVTLYEGEEVSEVFPVSELPPVRLADLDMGSTVIEGKRVPLVGYGQMVNAPVQRAETYYIVSLPVALAVRRSDFLVPYHEVRDQDGRIIGCRYLAKVV